MYSIYFITVFTEWWLTYIKGDRFNTIYLHVLWFFKLVAYSMLGYSHRFHPMMYILHHCFLPLYLYDIILLPLPPIRYLVVYIPDRHLLCSWFVWGTGSHYAVVATRFQAHQEGDNFFLPPPALQFLFHLLYLRHPYVADSFERNLINIVSLFGKNSKFIQ